MASTMLLPALMLLFSLFVLSTRPGEEEQASRNSHFVRQSPPVYPPPSIDGREWAEAYGKAQALVRQMKLEEKVSLTGGISHAGGCSGIVPPIKRLGFTGMCLSDAANGLRGTDLVNAYPSGIHAGASWNRKLAFRRGAAMGGEFRRKGVNVLLGPVVGPAGRIVRGGRNWEGFSVDPWLSGALVKETVGGIQSQGVQACVKHYVGNEQESFRKPSIFSEAVSSNIDDKPMHEVYLWAFQDAVKAGAGSIMCSYQRINNSYGCANSKTLNGLLKSELGFQGFVVSDWDAQLAGVATALAGLDMAMPNGDQYWGNHLLEAVKNGSVPESRLNDMAMRIITTWYQLRQDALFPDPGLGMPADIRLPHEAIEGRDRQDLPTLMDSAIEGHVLVKNTKSTLPLKSLRQLSLFGYSAKSPDLYGPGPGIIEYQKWLGGGQVVGSSDLLPDVPGNPMKQARIASNGVLFGGCGSGATTPAVFSSPFESLKARAVRDGTALFHDFVSSLPVVDPLSDACIVLGNAWACEGFDRPALSDSHTDDMIEAVASQCSKTIVVLHNAGVRLVDAFADHPNVTAIIFAHLPGRDAGDALVSLLYGESSPSGKLPYTVARREADYGPLLKPEPVDSNSRGLSPQSDFKEGVYHDYKSFEQRNVEPRYEFGFGLSYTTFSFSRLRIEGIQEARMAEFPIGTVRAGGQVDLWDELVMVKAEVRNTGRFSGAEVVQLYLGVPGGPLKQLRGFEKLFLRPGEGRAVSFRLKRRDLSVWDTRAQMWRLQRGRYEVYVGNSSRNLPLQGSLTM